MKYYSMDYYYCYRKVLTCKYVITCILKHLLFKYISSLYYLVLYYIESSIMRGSRTRVKLFHLPLILIKYFLVIIVCKHLQLEIRLMEGEAVYFCEYWVFLNKYIDTALQLTLLWIPSHSSLDYWSFIVVKRKGLMEGIFMILVSVFFK